MVQDYMKQWVEQKVQDIRESVGLERQPVAMSHPTTANSSLVPIMSSRAAEAPNSAGQTPIHESNPHVTSSSQHAMQIDDFPPSATPLQGNAGPGDVNRSPKIQNDPKEMETPRVVVDRPPRLPSVTQRAIENIVRAHMERLGVNARPQQANERPE